MAVSSTESGDTGVWWSSWLSSAREKSMSALSATKRDLAEFVSVLGSDTKAAVEGASANINKILTTSTAEGSKPNTKDDVSRVMEVQPQAPYDRSQAELFSIQNSMDTYLQDPPNQAGEDDYEKWKASFDIQSYLSDISNLLVSCSHVRTKHSQLVPAKVSYETFWMRYFYRIQQLEKEEKRRADLMARASNRAQEQLQWDEVEDAIVVGSPLKLKVDNSHQRSGSSTDSFVCISEDTGAEGERPPSRGTGTGSWEQVENESGLRSHGSSSKFSEVGEEDSGLDRLLKRNPSLLRNISDVELAPPNKDVQAEEDDKKAEEDAGSNSSDWENWDD